MELTAVELMYIGIVASVIVQALRILVEHFDFELGLEATNVVLFVVAMTVAVAFRGLPAFGGENPAEIAQAVLMAALQVVGVAGLIYNILLKKVLQSA